MSKPFVTCRLMGGLGNQMFQIAHVLAQAKKNNVDYILPNKSYTPLQGKQTLNYVNNIFSKLKFSNDIKVSKVVNSPKFSFTPYNELITNSIAFNGYYQSQKNFYGYDDYIKSFFKPSEETIKKLISKYPLLSNDVTAIHVRRGDYLKFPDVHPVVTKTYINKGLEIINNDNPIFVFTDDPSWCLENLNFKFKFIKEEDYMEMWIMSMCKDFVISSSSFSWWGSFLSDKNGIVVSPSQWFGPKGYEDFNDIYRKNFKKIVI